MSRNQRPKIFGDEIVPPKSRVPLYYDKLPSLIRYISQNVRRGKRVKIVKTVMSIQ